MIETYFAEAKRNDELTLQKRIRQVNDDPVVSGLLHVVSGLLAILDDKRQIISLNDSFCAMLGIQSPVETLGLRPGEALHCIHAHEGPAGCGTTKFCSTCGAAIAIVASLTSNETVERLCAMAVDKNGHTTDIALKVRSQPIEIDGNRFVLLFLQDITVEQHRAALERTFFHDISNMLTGLLGASELLYYENSQSNLAKIIRNLSVRMTKELTIQKLLINSDLSAYKPKCEPVDAYESLKELQDFFACHPLTESRKLDIAQPLHSFSITTDRSLLLRIVSNMISNALEATSKNGKIKIWLKKETNRVSYCVWNQAVIPQDIGRRIFQRNFSTKDGAGRGVGTYSMKLFAEEYLGGKVDFSTSKEQGTIFRLTLPC
ncbi:sensor histidine kinase [Desulfogranum marinum]|uniref:sensor histidine kinase n=1 Tax=Desulfogranum marinum TaxID=453220 RepID=UPI0019666CBD|nr:ATP-binding protein [Desulfogranum marinum]MBM9512936.1 GHKL domain-containing protein [Desulfogranum marinum]